MVVQSGAGTGSGFTDELYAEAGATIAADADEVFRAAEELGIDLSRREPSSVEEV